MAGTKLLPTERAFRTRVLCTAVPLAVLVGCFARWLVGNPGLRIASVVTAAALTLLYACCLIRLVPQWQRAWSGEPLPAAAPAGGKRSLRKARMHPLFKIVLFAALTRLLLLIAAYVIAAREGGYQGGVFDRLRLWLPAGSDGSYYLAIAEHWYAGSADGKLLLIFFPFYPAVVRAANYIFQSYFVTGLFVSNLALVFSAYLLYELLLLDTDRAGALRGVKYLCILPATFLLSTPVPDSLFLLLSLSCLLFCRKRSYPLAGLMGLLAALCESYGVLLIVPVAVELISELRFDRKAGETGPGFRNAYVWRFLSLLLIPLGTVGYLLLNRTVAGDAFAYAGLLNTGWGRSADWFFGTAGQDVAYLAAAQAAGGFTEVVGLWLPNLLALFLPVLFVLIAAPRMRTSSIAYFLLFFAMAAGSSGQISMPRLMLSAYPLYAAISACTRRRAVDWALTLLSLMALLFYLYAFVMQWGVV